MKQLRSPNSLSPEQEVELMRLTDNYLKITSPQDLTKDHLDPKQSLIDQGKASKVAQMKHNTAKGLKLP